MTTTQIARLFKARRAGRGKFIAKCPVHGRDRSPSLYITERKDGNTGVHCFAGCDVRAVLGAVGIGLKDLFLDSDWKPSPEMLERRRDEDRLALYERQHGLAIMAQVVFPGERNYWRAVERNIAVRGRALRDKLYPSEKKQREVYRIIREYGLDELWECVPCSNFAKN